MASEGFNGDDWDNDFLDKLLQAEELALSTQISRTYHPPPPPPPPQPPLLPSPAYGVSYSPPRELSQRPRELGHTGGVPDYFDSFFPRGTHFAKEQEIDRPKRDLNRVSKQRNDLKRLDFRKERDKKEQQPEVIHSKIEAKDAEFYQTKDTEMDCLDASPTDPGISTVCRNENASNEQLKPRTKSCDAGVQTDKTTESSSTAVQNTCRVSEKLVGLWNSDDQKLGRVLVAQLFMTCEKDFHVLFGYLNSPKADSSMALSDQPGSIHPIETAKVSHLFSVLTKIGYDTLRLEDLLEALVDLCSLKNVVIIHSSLRVLHKILNNSSSMKNEFGKRENVTVEESLSENTNECRNSESLSFANVAEILKQSHIPSELNLFNVKTPGHSRFFDCSFGVSISGVYWVSLFERMCLISIQNNEKQIRREALSIMNLILMRQNAYLERDKFVGEVVFRSLSQLLRREAGFSVQDQAVHTLYLLCNCPKTIAMLCSGSKEDGEQPAPEFSSFQGFNEILIGLADCVASYRSATAEEMKLRRNAIAFLAFLGSLGKSGFEVLINHTLPKGTNFLAIILQGLTSDLDLHASKCSQKSDVVREQILLIREALILLNRLASHPQHSGPVLEALTNTREMASAAVDVANRLTNKSKLLWRNENTARQIRESEIMELARVFKKRIFTFLGDSIS
ncbi:hypothetical protein ACP275_01G060300 [Erythranthe tilingii]